MKLRNLGLRSWRKTMGLGAILGAMLGYVLGGAIARLTLRSMARGG